MVRSYFEKSALSAALLLFAIGSIGCNDSSTTTINPTPSPSPSPSAGPIIEPAPTISVYGSPFQYYTGDSESIIPNIAHATSVSISPPLENGLTLDTTTGVIGGTVTGTLSPTTYTITATSVDGQFTQVSTTFVLSILTPPASTGSTTPQTLGLYTDGTSNYFLYPNGIIQNLGQHCSDFSGGGNGVVVVYRNCGTNWAVTDSGGLVELGTSYTDFSGTVTGNSAIQYQNDGAIWEVSLNGALTQLSSSVDEVLFTDGTNNFYQYSNGTIQTLGQYCNDFSGGGSGAIVVYQNCGDNWAVTNSAGLVELGQSIDFSGTTTGSSSVEYQNDGVLWEVTSSGELIELTF